MAAFSSLAALLALVLVVLALRRKKTPAPLPPGPPADPLIGHARVFPRSDREETFKRWGVQYGNVLYFKILGQSLVVLNDYEDAINLLEKKGANYSDRPELTTVKLMGYGDMSSVLPYGAHWRSHRKLLQDKLTAKACTEYQDIQQRQVKVLLQRLLGFRGDCNQAIERYSAASVIEIVYGHQVNSDDDEYFAMGREAVHAVEAASLGTSLVDLFPSLQHVPHWLPGCSSFTAVPRRWRPAVEKMFNHPFEAALRQMRSGRAPQCYVTNNVESFEQAGKLDDGVLQNIRDTALTFFIGGFDTTWSTLFTFVYAMLLFPEVQRNAQEEVDRVIGSDRLPGFDDRPHLPYLECVLQEVLRWNPVLPLGIPHRSLEDDVYNGMFIPKNTFVVPNSLGMNRNERVYRDPYKFYPERYLPEPQGYGEKHLVTAFGFGRRICPGRQLAEASVWIAAVSILATFNITNIVGEDGQKVVPKEAFEGVIVTHPKAFDCVFEPRSNKTELLLAHD